MHPNGNIYISNEDAAKASVIDPASAKVIAEIPVGLELEGVAISPDGKQVIVTSESTNMLHIIAVPEHKVVANILVGAPARRGFRARRENRLRELRNRRRGQTGGHGGPQGAE